ncbi:GT4 family glycosyltransferase PelF [Streptacidiphilus melanogenes]|uniref:GT4 family glycosyltransferase PelF n=1 Tax=Streptacidiphilus melanogenes TaxID=411235 RepID=UPI0007C76259|nr:GT4 family glycosyltransferase PelF [Streptacidiphilus melanogenes]
MNSPGPLEVTLLTEGTYPYIHGGVSTWCDQLVHGMPDVRFHVLGITGSGAEPVVWPLPRQVASVSTVPLWGPTPQGRAPRGRALRRFLAGYERFLLSLLDPDFEHHFADELYQLSELALTGGSLTAALRTEGALRSLQGVWRLPFLPTSRDRPSLRDALEGTDLLEHALRPLAVQPPARGVAHVATGGLAALPALAARRFHGVPLLLSEHGIYLRERFLGFRNPPFCRPVKTLLLGFYRMLATESYRCADVVAPCNRYNRRWEEHGGCDPQRIRTVYNGVDLGQFPVAGPEPEELTLSWAGRIDPIKDLETLLRAFALVRAELPRVRLRLFGGVPAGGEAYRARLDALAAELGVSEGVAFEGRIDAVRNAYAAGSVVLLSSISEGFPFSLIEAMACGRATVSTDVGGVREAVGDTGLVVPAREPEALAAATLALLRDPGRRARLGAAARRRVTERFTVERTVAEYRALYGELTQEGASAAQRGVAGFGQAPTGTGGVPLGRPVPVHLPVPVPVGAAGAAPLSVPARMPRQRDAAPVPGPGPGGPPGLPGDGPAQSADDEVAA